MQILRILLVSLAAAAAGMAQLPEFYKTASRLTWVVENIDKVRPAWEALGLTDIQEYPNIQLTGEFRGKPITIYAWQITGRLGNLTVDMIQPGEGQDNAYTIFLSKHGDGIFSIVHEVATKQELEKETLRLKGKGVAVLQKVTLQRDPASQTYTYFDTEPEGKFSLGLILRGQRAGASQGPAMVSHIGNVIWDSAPISAYWAKLGFPAFTMQRTTPRPDFKYKGQPLSLIFDVGYQRHTQLPYEWISPPAAPDNIYADFLKKHKREGIQHIGVPVPNLQEAVAAYKRLGYGVRQSGAWGDIGKPGSGQYAYMDTDSAGGVSVELVERYQ